MDMTGLTRFIGGLALFLYGMHVLGEGLAKLSGGKLEGVASIAISQSPEAGARVPSGSVVTVEFTERDPAVENTLSADSPEEGDGE